MQVKNLSEFVKGWFIGPFEPTLIHTDLFECAVKKYKSGDSEPAHMHKIATELTVIANGTVLMNGVKYGADTVIVTEPGETTDFHAISDVTTFVVKMPAVLGDKYLAKDKS